ncbi:uracil-DNA glycosylase [Arsenophonus symbiont of Ornithomya chloropus]|uniref:uracil-DNA glycosylase n=1 Tax=Arsenophonus symbiont of Ornithomya chloropus TaxID=634121 RepID=UPI0032B191B6
MCYIPTWVDIINKEKQEDYFCKIFKYLTIARKIGKIIYPPNKDIFNAFYYTKLSKIKVVILGQDPYHGPNQAHGFAFSVPKNIKIPPSLFNIYKELKTDIPNFKYPNHGCLINWAQQGVLLLNTVLTVESGKAHSHFHLGWEKFTNKIIMAINQYCIGVIFLLWGSHAQKKSQFINTKKHFLLQAPHPSPLSAYKGFFGCKHFSKTNEILIKKGLTVINWTSL